jgi:hypothetical protein
MKLYKIESLKPIKGVIEINQKSEDQTKLYQNGAILITVNLLLYSSSSEKTTRGATLWMDLMSLL